MNPHHLDATSLMIWGLVAHLIADWPLQSDWMAKHKANLKHSAAIQHGFIHAVALGFVFGWVSVPLAVVHMLIDTRKPVEWWSKRIGQTQPLNRYTLVDDRGENAIPIYDVGTEVRFWTDQVFHIVCIAIAALIIG